MLVPFGCLFPNHVLRGHDKESHSSFGDGVAITAWHTCTHFKIIDTYPLSPSLISLRFGRRLNKLEQKQNFLLRIPFCLDNAGSPMRVPPYGGLLDG